MKQSLVTRGLMRPNARRENALGIRIPGDASAMTIEADLERADARKSRSEVNHQIQVVVIVEVDGKRSEVCRFEWHNAEPLGDDRPLPSVTMRCNQWRGGFVHVSIRSKSRCQCGCTVEFS